MDVCIQGASASRKGLHLEICIGGGGSASGGSASRESASRGLHGGAYRVVCIQGVSACRGSACRGVSIQRVSASGGLHPGGSASRESA